MKQFFTILAVASLSTAANAQITINATDMPMPTAAYNELSISPSAPNPTRGTNMVWDYGTYGGTATTTLFTPETDTFFTHAGIDFNAGSFKSFNAMVGYNYTSEIDFNSTSVQEAGVYIPFQAYDISSYTGGSSDSMVIPEQKYILSTPKTFVQFPFTYGTNWTTVSRREVNFNLTVAAFSLSHTPAKHVWYANRKDSVIGWGKMRVYTSGGPSIQYDVLMDRIEQFARDSFYLSGAPAPAAMLTAMNVAQNQYSDTSYRYNFYRKGSFNFLMSLYYRHDYTYSTPISIYISTDSVITATGVEAVAPNVSSVVVYPCPSTGQSVNVMITGTDVTPGEYVVTDLLGRTIQNGKATLKNGSVAIDFAQPLSNGMYVVRVYGTNHTLLANEQFSVTH